MSNASSINKNYEEVGWTGTNDGWSNRTSDNGGLNAQYNNSSLNTSNSIGTNYLGAYFMHNGSIDYEPQRTNNFIIEFPNAGLSTLKFAVKSVDGLGINISPIKVTYGNNSINYAGKPEYNDLSITIRDFIGLDTEQELMTWHNKVYDPKSQAIGFAAQYKQSGILREFAPNGTVLRGWNLYGCFPSNITLGNFSYDDNSIREINATFLVDYAKLDSLG